MTREVIDAGEELARALGEIDRLKQELASCRECLKLTDSEQVRRLTAERDEARADLERLRAHGRAGRTRCIHSSTGHRR